MSFPTRERGLKCTLSNPNTILYSVVPHAGTWIEILRELTIHEAILVVPHAGTWIEISATGDYGASSASFPTRERGLK